MKEIVQSYHIYICDICYKKIHTGEWFLKYFNFKSHFKCSHRLPK